MDENGLKMVKFVHLEDGQYFYKDLVSRSQYENVYVGSEDVYSLVRYYKVCKSISGLKLTIIKAVNVSTKAEQPHYCVVYCLDGHTPEEAAEVCGSIMEITGMNFPNHIYGLIHLFWRI